MDLTIKYISFGGKKVRWRSNKFPVTSYNYSIGYTILTTYTIWDNKGGVPVTRGPTLTQEVTLYKFLL